MPEPNGTGRLDRIEKILEMFIADHERIRQEHERIRQEHDRFRQEHEDFQEAFERDLKQLLIAQVLQADEIEKLWRSVRANSSDIRELSKQAEQDRKQIGDRIDNLARAIGELIRSRPA
jgi:predicted  nucleic acid-binding Zn-ribbon protein